MVARHKEDALIQPRLSDAVFDHRAFHRLEVSSIDCVLLYVAVING